MRAVPAIAAPLLTDELAADQVIVWREEERHAETSNVRYEQKAAEARETAKMRKLMIGELCTKQRAKWPTSGPNARGWGEWLARAKLDDSTAWRYMDAWKNRNKPDGDDVGDPSQDRGSRGKSGSPAIGDRDVKPDNDPPAPPPAVTEADVMALLDQLDQDARGRVMRSLRSKQGRENEGDRDAYCTPPQITAALPEVDFDPCSNPRSTVRARRSIQLERGENGLEVAWVGSGFWNIPYSKPLPWAEKFERERAAITMAGWLVNEDHSPQWWHLITQTLPIRLDFDDRLEFVPPPGVPTSKNDRPQTLLMDAPFWAGCDQAALLAMGKLWVRADHAQEFARTTTALRIVR